MPEENSRKGFPKVPKPEYMTRDEISEYFSRDIQFDWPEPYEPKYPLTRGEERLEALNKYPGSFTDYTHGRLRIVPIIERIQDPSEWLQAELKPVVQEELDRAEADDKEEPK